MCVCVSVLICIYIYIYIYMHHFKQAHTQTATHTPTHPHTHRHIGGDGMKNIFACFLYNLISAVHVIFDDGFQQQKYRQRCKWSARMTVTKFFLTINQIVFLSLLFHHLIFVYIYIYIYHVSRSKCFKPQPDFRFVVCRTSFYRSLPHTN